MPIVTECVPVYLRKVPDLSLNMEYEIYICFPTGETYMPRHCLNQSILSDMNIYSVFEAK